ncbi:MAG: hypothetical protein ACI8UO_003303, partial [Verrucomicrobiales bacterium]
MSHHKKASDVGARLGHRVNVRALKKGSHSRYNWRATYIEEGARRQKYFRTKKDAEKWAAERESETISFGTGASLSASERSAVADTRERLKAAGVDLRIAVEFAIDHFERMQKSATVDRLMQEILESRRQSGASEKHRNDLRYKLERFRTTFGKRVVAGIGRDEVANWLHGLKVAPSSINSYRRILILAFNHAIDSGYTNANPAAKVR